MRATSAHVPWGPVLFGLLLAIGGGVALAFGAWTVGMMALDGFSRPVSITIAATAPAVVYLPVYLALRRKYPNFCAGFAVGACLMIIIAGACNAVFVTNWN